MSDPAQERAKLDAIDATPILPSHIVDTIEAIGRLHDNHDRAATSTQRVVENITGFFSRPGTVVRITLLCALWMAANLGAVHFNFVPLDPPPFQWLQGFLALVAVVLTCMILTTQRRADTLASHRAQLTLELALLAEQKSAKTIALLEEMRRDNPLLANRVDEDALALSAPTDPNAVLDAIVERAGDKEPETLP